MYMYVCMELTRYLQGSSPSIDPLEYDVTLRPGVPLILPIDITAIRNIPLDLYILFDLSMSLSNAFAATRQISDQIR